MSYRLQIIGADLCLVKGDSKGRSYIRSAVPIKAILAVPPPPVAGMETTAEERELWRNGYHTRIRAILRDFDRQHEALQADANLFHEFYDAGNYGAASVLEKRLAHLSELGVTPKPTGAG